MTSLNWVSRRVKTCQPASTKVTVQPRLTMTAALSGVSPSSDQRQASISPDTGLRTSSVWMVDGDPSSGYPTGDTKRAACRTSGITEVTSRKRTAMEETSSVRPQTIESSNSSRAGTSTAWTGSTPYAAASTSDATSITDAAGRLP